MAVLPSRIETERLVLRSWTAADVPVLHAAVDASFEHLRPWMDWARERVVPAYWYAMVEQWHEERQAGSGAVYGIRRAGDDLVLGGCGLHRRRGPGVLEVGYWAHADHTGQGYVSEAVAAVTATAFAQDGIERVEIHHDRANRASRAIPERLGFTFGGESPGEPGPSPKEGVDCTWSLTAAAWSSHHTGGAG